MTSSSATDNYASVFVGETTVRPAWQHLKQREARLCQTDKTANEEAEVQTDLSALKVSEHLDKAEGTDSRAPDLPAARMEGSQNVYANPAVNDDKLAAFLSSVMDDMVQMLQSNLKSTAFDRYEPNWTETHEDVTLAMTLAPPFTAEGEWHATSISWNSNGSTVAVAYGRVDTVSWCSSKGYVCAWNIHRADIDCSRPHVTLEADSFVNALAFHPSSPAILAAGTYNGEVILWNVTDNNAKPVSSVSSAIGSREPIAQLQWLQNFREVRESHRYVLCSASQDAKILFWTPQKMDSPISGYEVQNKKRNLVGVQSMSFVKAGMSFGRCMVPGVENLMMLGLESGDLFRTKPGNSVADPAVQQGKGRQALSVLEVDHFEGHLGPVNSVDCSPFFRNLFLTCSSDGCVRLYSTLERSPLTKLEPSSESKHFLYGAQFSPTRASVLAAVSRSGQLHLYDLEQSRTKPCVSVDAGADGVAVVSLAFNVAVPNLLASGDLRGNVRIWQLSTKLSQPSDMERAAVRFTEGNGAPAPSGSTDSAATNVNPVRQLLGFQI